MFDFWRVSEYYLIVELAPDLEIDIPWKAEKSTMLSNLEAFILSNSKRIKNKIMFAIDVFKTKKIFLTDAGFSISKTVNECIKKKMIMAMVLYSMQCSGSKFKILFNYKLLWIYWK